jgi:NAD-dependent dihydropyrimidine dehydrogenase PreA subunit
MTTTAPTATASKRSRKGKLLSQDACKEPGVLVPLVDRARCEGKRDCVDVCPYDVFEVRRMDDADFVALGFFARLKSRAHGRMTAYTPRAADCHACGLCVTACPEKAIRLGRPAVEVTRDP